MNKERPARDAGNNFPCVEFHHGAGEWNKGRHREKSLARNLNGREEAAGSTSSRLSLDRQWTVWRPRSGTGDSGGQGSAGPRLAGSAHLRSKKAVDGSGLQKRPCREQQALAWKCA